MKHNKWATRILVSSLGVLLGLALIFGLERSLHVWPAVLGDERAGVLLTARCAACEVVFKDYEANPEKWVGVIPVPLDEPGGPFGDAVCDATLEALSGPRYVIAKLLPKKAVCARLAADALIFAREEGLVVTPSFFSRGRLLKMDQVASVLGFDPPYTDRTE